MSFNVEIFERNSPTVQSNVLKSIYYMYGKKSKYVQMIVLETLDLGVVNPAREKHANVEFFFQVQQSQKMSL